VPEDLPFAAVARANRWLSLPEVHRLTGPQNVAERRERSQRARCGPPAVAIAGTSAPRTWPDPHLRPEAIARLMVAPPVDPRAPPQPAKASRGVTVLLSAAEALGRVPATFRGVAIRTRRPKP